ncbi:hypothetical protein NQ152_02260 [Microbacterium sp. zg.B48]|nr:MULTISPECIES: hypothetical protein [unclassified Microbacterium]MCR2762326.1 hypothetical protein [Microbacterium sp. zg.B48]MCR2809668.1 hypothetical protein [Microbacterium sp. zg.B185]WIM18010.1 hypothetical protein QNO12_10355 [Microbacterium sp. zg-B185]
MLDTQLATSILVGTVAAIAGLGLIGTVLAFWSLGRAGYRKD